MKAYRTYITVTEPNQVTLTDVPFYPGERVEVLLLTQNKPDFEAVQTFKNLLKETQSLPQVQALTDEEIAEEVAAYRNSQ